MRSMKPILRKIRQISEQFPFENNPSLRKELMSLVSQINQDTLELRMPETVPSNLPVSVLCGNVYRDLGKMECGIFALPRTGDKLPLHDHPKMEGFIKPIAGKLLITSFSWLTPDEERDMLKQNGSNGNVMRPAKFEGKNTKLTLLIFHFRYFPRRFSIS